MNYVGVAETLGVSSSAQASGLAADNLLCALYFAYIFHLGRDSPPDTIILEESGTDNSTSMISSHQSVSVYSYTAHLLTDTDAWKDAFALPSN